MKPNRTPESPQVSSPAANPFLHAYFFGIGPSGSDARAQPDASGPSRTTSPETAFPRDAANDNERTL